MSESSAAYVLTEESPEYRVSEALPRPVNYARSSEFLRSIQGKRSHPGVATPAQQAHLSAEICHEMVKELRGKLESCETNKERALVASALKNAISAWDTACERERIARGRPLPGVLKAGDAPRRGKSKGKPQHSTFSEIPTSGPLTPVSKQSLTATPRQAEDMTEPESNPKSNSGAFGAD